MFVCLIFVYSVKIVQTARLHAHSKCVRLFVLFEL